MKDANGQGLGAALREIRTALGLTRTQVARAAGVSLFIIAGLEDGTVAHPDPYVRFLGRAYRVDEYAERRASDPARHGAS